MSASRDKCWYERLPYWVKPSNTGFVIRYSRKWNNMFGNPSKQNKKNNMFCRAESPLPLKTLCNIRLWKLQLKESKSGKLIPLIQQIGIIPKKSSAQLLPSTGTNMQGKYIRFGYLHILNLSINAISWAHPLN